MEKPILFSDEMVQAILDGRKTQTRRVLKIQPPDATYKIDGTQPYFPKPYAVGDRLWVREAWRPSGVDEPASIYYRAGGNKRCPESKDLFRLKPNDGPNVWRPSIFMPRWASRISLVVTKIKADRIQNITDKDAIAEGIDRTGILYFAHAIQKFKKLWDSINKKRGFGWDTNPVVWAIEFKRLPVDIQGEI